jgi:hypothetical protein
MVIAIVVSYVQDKTRLTVELKEDLPARFFGGEAGM